MNFWKQVSNWSTVLCGILLISQLFFKQYLKSYNNAILTYGILVILLFLFSNFIRFMLKKQNGE